MKTVSIFPPEVLQYFDRLLLNNYIPKLREDSSNLFRAYNYIYYNQLYKTRYSEINKQRCMNLCLEFKEIYERIKEKEKELESETCHKTKRPFYFIICSNRRSQTIFNGLKYKNITSKYRINENNEFPKI